MCTQINWVKTHSKNKTKKSWYYYIFSMMWLGLYGLWYIIYSPIYDIYIYIGKASISICITTYLDKSAGDLISVRYKR